MQQLMSLASGRLAPPGGAMNATSTTREEDSCPAVVVTATGSTRYHFLSLVWTETATAESARKDLFLGGRRCACVVSDFWFRQMFLALDAIVELSLVDDIRCVTIFARDLGTRNWGNWQILVARKAVRLGCVPITLLVVDDPVRSTIRTFDLRGRQSPRNIDCDPTF